MTMKKIHYSVVALHEGTYAGGRPGVDEVSTITKERLKGMAPSMIHRPLRQDHEQWLPYPENTCEYFFYAELDGEGLLAGDITVSEEIDAAIQRGDIIPFVSVDMNKARTPDGLELVVWFDGLSLLTKGRTPRDRRACILTSTRREESLVSVMENDNNKTTSSPEVKWAATESEDSTSKRQLAQQAYDNLTQKMGMSTQDIAAIGIDAATDLAMHSLMMDGYSGTEDTEKKATFALLGAKYLHDSQLKALSHTLSSFEEEPAE